MSSIAPDVKIPSKKKNWYPGLFAQVLIAMVLGTLVGRAFPEYGDSLKLLGDAFINLIKMIIGPIIFCTIVTGVAGVENLRHAGRVGVKALIYFEVVTTIALVVGLLAAHLINMTGPMALSGSDLDPSTIAAVQEKAGTHMATTGEFLMAIIPHTFVSAFTEGNILQVLLIALLVSAGVMMTGPAKAKPAVKGVEAFSKIIFNIVGIIVKVAPIGVFGAVAYSVSKFGFGTFRDLGMFALLFLGSCVFFIVVVMGAIMRLYCGLSLFKFIRYLREEIAIAFGTASSETVLPRMIDRLTELGCERPVVGMVIPTGYSFNLDGTTLYLALAAIFIGHSTGVEMTLWQQLSILAVLMVTSKGAAGVFGSGFVVLAATVSTFNIFPADKLAIVMAMLFSIDRIVAPGRVLTNLIGNGVATVAVAKWEKQLDIAKAKAMLDKA
ncbi:MAG: cation:dicarboxylase symporter family transporter [Alphaproteobacteria bacterium]|nr:cation:dicarboxylase symporter family transporter [Alphaproteobacteria bacterium]